jgi:hypothetical protein
VQLEAPLNPDLEYFDATPSIEALAQEVQRLHTMLEDQAGINSKLLLIAKDLQSRLSVLEQEKSGLILPERFDS